MDGGIHTGITVEATPILEHYAAPDDEFDPALAWSVDLRCEGPRLPTEPQRVRDWFLSHSQLMRDGLSHLAEELTAGIDIHTWPLQRSIDGPRGVKIRIVCFALPRRDALNIAAILKDIGDHLEERIRNLKEVDAVAH